MKIVTKQNSFLPLPQKSMETQISFLKMSKLFSLQGQFMEYQKLQV